jgi:hypothetical protein
MAQIHCAAGALLDAELLAAVYVELTTTRQAALQLEPIASGPSIVPAIVRTRPTSIAAARDRGGPHGAPGVCADARLRGGLA